MTNEHSTSSVLDRHAEFAGSEVMEQLHSLAKPLTGLRVVHVNSTRRGGGVAEILETLIPLMRELGLDASWEVIDGNDEFFASTKAFHNTLQGKTLRIDDEALRTYEEMNAQNAEKLRPILEDADVVFVHDPQPAPLITPAFVHARPSLLDRVEHLSDIHWCALRKFDPQLLTAISQLQAHGLVLRH